jgi:hypothetical protein
MRRETAAAFCVAFVINGRAAKTREEREHEAHRGNRDRVDQCIAEVPVDWKAAVVINGTKPPPQPLPM